MQAKEILEIWNHYFNERDVNSIVNLYHNESILLPTFSNHILTGREKIKEYFKKVLIDQKVSVDIVFSSVIEEKIGGNIFLLSGNYIFEFNENNRIHSRFTFLLSILSDNPIKNHHSSRTPID